MTLEIPALLGASTQNAVHPSHARTWLLHSALRIDAPPRPPELPALPDAFVLDIEDAVPVDGKAAARAVVVEWLDSYPAWVRINDAASEHWVDDLAAVASAPRLLGVVLAKAESAADVRRTAALLPHGTLIVPMIESAVALQNVESIAASAPTFRIALGTGDFCADTGLDNDPVALAYAKSRIVMASAAAGLDRPIDGPPPSTDAEAGITHSRRLGMAGRLVLDPAHIAPVNAALRPTAAAVDDARRTLAVSAGPARDGSYLPALAKARAVLALHDVFAQE